MAFGELVGELKAKTTSTKVQPFEDSGRGVRLEFNWSADQSGRIRGTMQGTTYVVTAPDGTATSKGYGLITTSDGDLITVEAFSVTLPPSANGSAKFRGIAYSRTSSQKYEWVNTTPLHMKANRILRDFRSRFGNGSSRRSPAARTF
jgi:hypothetical protein